MDLYHDGMRVLQARHEGREVPDWPVANRMRKTFYDEDREFIQSSPFFFLSMADGEEPSVYVPSEGYTPPDPPWKSMPWVKEVFDKERWGDA